MSKIISKLNLTDHTCISIIGVLLQSIPSGIDTPITTFNGFLINQGNAVISVSNNVFTVKVPGLYFITADVSFYNNSIGYRSMHFIASNSPTFHRGQILVPAVIGNHTMLSSSSILKLAANETVTVYVLQNSGGGLSIIANNTWAATEISIFKL